MSSTPTHIKPKWLQNQSIQNLVSLFNQGAIPFRFVGGCVRNGLLNLPVADVDVATPVEPLQIMSFLKKEGVKVLPTGLSHGTVTALIENEPIEITTLRCDVACDGRHAEVTFTDDWTQDAKRRDFTMNAIYCDGDGKLYDDVGGVQDALQGIVRFIGDPYQRIHEDYLRLLRFFRFYAYYGRAPIDRAGLKVAQELASNLTKLSGERIQAELFKIFKAPNYLKAIDLIMKHHILDAVLPIAKEGDVLLHHFDQQMQKLPRELLSLEEFPLVLLRLAIILEPGKDSAKTVAHRLKLSREDADWLKYILHPSHLESQRDWYHHLYFKGRAPTLALCLFQVARQQADLSQSPWQSIIELINTWQDKPFPIRGQDLVDQGLQPSPEISKGLKQLEIWWLDHDREPGKEEVLKYFARAKSVF